MISPVLIWGGALAVYAVFYIWYHGFDGRLRQDEIDEFFARVDVDQLGVEEQEKFEGLRRFCEADDGRDFVMVNLIAYNPPVRESVKTLNIYQKAFLGALLRSGGHPLAVARGAGKNVELWGVENGDDWHLAALIRYRSRRSMLNALSGDAFTDTHHHKVNALLKTIAFPASPYFVVGGGPKFLVPLLLAFIAMTCQYLIA
ncbi:hypothetical protein [Litorivivens sp.]|uniref:hypothetical protein n=1 Tax=Litorivivens sp. TaxID=2020868 RepID=UPI0035648D02